MTTENVVNEVREALNGKPGQPIVLGVCKTLAARYDKEVWILRLVAIATGLFWTLPVLAAYIILGFTLTETEERTRGFFSGLAVIIRETVEKLFSIIRDVLGNNDRGSRSNGY